MANKKFLITLIAAVALIAFTAAASAYITTNVMNDEKSETVKTERRAKTEKITWSDQRAQTPRNVPPPCDDDNIVGKVVGGAAGGLAGSQIGNGSGKTAATIGGAVGGTLLGEEYIPTKNVTCR